MSPGIEAVNADFLSQPSEPAAPIWQQPKHIEQRLADVDYALKHALLSSMYSHVNQLSSHLFNAGGKRLRPTLVLLAANLRGIDKPEVTQSAVAVEMLHMASLYHDDVIDGATHRRHEPCAHRVWGNGAAVLTGTYLFSQALGILSSLGQGSNRFASEAVCELWRGQTLECELAFNTDINESQYYASVKGKTASLCRLPCLLGALHGGHSTHGIETLANFGSKIGLAYQIADDILDIAGDDLTLCKPPKIDLSEGIYTLPTILCLKRHDHYGDKLRQLLHNTKPSPGLIMDAAALIIESGAIKQASIKVTCLIHEAIDLLDELEPTQAKSSLIDFASWIADRATLASISGARS